MTVTLYYMPVSEDDSFISINNNYLCTLFKASVIFCFCVLFLQTNGGSDQFEQCFISDQFFHHHILLMCKSKI